MNRALLMLLVSLTVFSSGGKALSNQQESIQLTVGSKKFTESVILGDIVNQLIRTTDVSSHHRHQLGGTRVLWSALLKGEIDIYPEYTGTIQREILLQYGLNSEQEIRNKLAEFGITMSRSLGFNNTYAIGMKRVLAEKYGIMKISHLRRHPRLKFGFTNEFMDREDGWQGLRSHYQLPQSSVRGLDHDLAYRGIESGSIDVLDMYSTDAEIDYYDLLKLEDDMNYFPRYEAVLLFRSELKERIPRILDKLMFLEDHISESEMINMNSQAKLNGMNEKQIAASFLTKSFGIQTNFSQDNFWQRLGRNTADHLILVTISLSAAIVIAVSLGILAVKMSQLGKIILGVVGIIQTIPSLALLVFMIPLLGIGGPPAVMALFLYSLLPIVRNTYTGIRDIPVPIIESACALGLPATARLRRIELPMASSTILAGIKTSAVINIGTATLGALIGAGGYGQPILTGIRLDNIGMILEGAVPAAILAILVQGLFDLAERIIVPRGLRL